MLLRKQRGFTITELLVAIIVLSLLITVLVSFFWSSFTSFFKLQETEITLADKSRVMQRMTQVIRSGTTITEATPTALTIHAYFSPQDEKLSQVRYAYDSAAKKLIVTRIPASGEPPSYTYPPEDASTTVLLSAVQLQPPIFTYRDANGEHGPFTADTYKDIKGVMIELASPATTRESATHLKTNIELRNRKTNL